MTRPRQMGDSHVGQGLGPPVEFGQRTRNILNLAVAADRTSFNEKEIARDDRHKTRPVGEVAADVYLPRDYPTFQQTGL